jgi:hypothetical protein
MQQADQYPLAERIDQLLQLLHVFHVDMPVDVAKCALEPRDLEVDLGCSVLLLKTASDRRSNHRQEASSGAAAFLET